MPKIFQKSRKFLQIEKNILSRNTSASSQHFVKIQHREKNFSLLLPEGIFLLKKTIIFTNTYTPVYCCLIFLLFSCVKLQFLKTGSLDNANQEISLT